LLYPFRPEHVLPRQVKLRKKTVGKSVHWCTKAGGDTYFVTVEEVPYKDARKLFADHLIKLQGEQVGNKGGALTAGELMDLFLDWVEKHRGDRTYSTRKTYCSRFFGYLFSSDRPCLRLAWRRGGGGAALRRGSRRSPSQPHGRLAEPFPQGLRRFQADRVATQVEQLQPPKSR
jgi:hypothetical protein